MQDPDGNYQPIHATDLRQVLSATGAEPHCFVLLRLQSLSVGSGRLASHTFRGRGQGQVGSIDRCQRYGRHNDCGLPRTKINTGIHSSARL